MDENLQAKIQEARDAGYSDEEIQQYLASKSQPLPQEQPIDRSGEYGATAMAAIPTAIELGAAGYGVKKLTDAFRGAPAPSTGTQPGSAMDIAKRFTTPSSGPVAPNPTVSPSYTAPAQQAAKPGLIEQGSRYAKEMQRIAAEKVMQTARAAAPAARAVAPAAIGLGALTFSGGLNTNEEEELKRRRQMAPTIR